MNNPNESRTTTSTNRCTNFQSEVLLRAHNNISLFFIMSVAVDEKFPQTFNRPKKYWKIVKKKIDKIAK